MAIISVGFSILMHLTSYFNVILLQHIWRFIKFFIIVYCACMFSSPRLLTTPGDSIPWQVLLRNVLFTVLSILGYSQDYAVAIPVRYLSSLYVLNVKKKVITDNHSGNCRSLNKDQCYCSIKVCGFQLENSQCNLLYRFSSQGAESLLAREYIWLAYSINTLALG